VRIKRYFAKDMRAALTEVKKELGPDAVIMSNKKTASGIEIVAAVDNDAVAASAKETAARITQAPAKALSAYAGLNDPEDKSMVASSLQELLSRQQGQPDDTTISKRETPDMSANRQKTERAVEALSQQAESEFEQWLSKARTTVAQTEEQGSDVVSEPVALHSKVEELNATRAPSQSYDNYEQKSRNGFIAIRTALHQRIA
jgi:flagellar biosynthesis protein FlhF